MKILYDNFIFQRQTIGGISRYFHELMNYYTKTNSLDFDFPIYYSINQYLQNADYTKKMQFLMNLPLVKIGEYRKFLRKKNNKAVIKALKTRKYDIFHPTYFDDSFFEILDKLPNSKLVITLHDMITENFPAYYGEEGKKIIEIKKELAHRADKIITISEFSKSEILRYYPTISENKIKVIYNGNSLENIKKPSKNNKYGDYILFVGARRYYKNFLLMLEAIAPILKEKKIKLICASSWDFDIEEQQLIDKLALNNLVINLKPSDKELFELYYNAICYIFPSLYEGFGLPIIEAFALDCPVICANNASLPEIAKDGAIYFDGTNKNSIYTVTKEVIENKLLRQSMIKKGRERLKDFSWAKTAQETKRVYEELV